MTIEIDRRRRDHYHHISRSTSIAGDRHPNRFPKGPVGSGLHPASSCGLNQVVCPSCGWTSYGAFACELNSSEGYYFSSNCLVGLVVLRATATLEVLGSIPRLSKKCYWVFL